MTLAVLLLWGTGVFAEVTRARFLMGTVCEVSADRDADVAAAFAEAARIEEFLSTWRAESELSCLNRGEVAEPSPELAALLDRAERWRDATGGAFEPRIRPLVEAWKTREEGAVPKDATLREALSTIASRRAPFEEGGFGKGYAIDRMLESAQLVNFGGQIGARGSSTVTIADPLRRDHAVVQFTLRDASLSTSGGSEKTFRIGKRLFTHIIDPRSGFALPPRGSASAVDASAFDADVLSTALYVMGPDEGLAWANANEIAALFITESNQIRVSDAFRRRIRDLRVLDRKFEIKD
jgi:thiamine biosynthesis lipoprotein